MIEGKPEIPISTNEAEPKDITIDLSEFSNWERIEADIDKHIEHDKDELWGQYDRELYYSIFILQKLKEFKKFNSLECIDEIRQKEAEKGKAFSVGVYNMTCEKMKTLYTTPTSETLGKPLS